MTDGWILALVLAFPLTGSLALLVSTGRLQDWLAGLLPGGYLALGLLTMVAGYERMPLEFSWTALPWLGEAGRVSLVLDPLAAVLLLVTLVIGFLVMVFSVSYMGPGNREHPVRGREGNRRYFFFLSLFIGCMVGVALSGSFLVLFFFWEGTTLCSWALISHHGDRPMAVRAALKALVMTHLGGVALIVALAVLFGLTEGFAFDAPRQVSSGVQGTVFVLFLVAAAAKSAQVPLFTWLPDAMEAPTPISAYLHAAAMVNAGVYLMARVILATEEFAAWTGGLMAAMALVTMAVGVILYFYQDDLKRLLAYSTIVQLGTMMLGLSLFMLGSRTGYVGAVFQLAMHGVAKALLFLCVGVIAMRLGVRSLSQLSGLASAMPLTAGAFFVGLLAVTGIPPFACFWSNLTLFTGILQLTGPALWLIGVLFVAELVVAFFWLLRVGQGLLFGAPSPVVAGWLAESRGAEAGGEQGARGPVPGSRLVQLVLAGLMALTVLMPPAVYPFLRRLATGVDVMGAGWGGPDALLLYTGGLSLIAGALLTAILPGRGTGAEVSRYGALVSVLAAAAAFVTVAVRVLAAGEPLGPLALWRPAIVPASLSLQVDALSAFFLLLIAVLAAVATWYSVGYTRRLEGNMRAFYPPLLLFVLGMAGVVVMEDFLFFLVPWEFMTLASYLLVIYHWERPADLAAGFRYFFLSHAGSVAFFAGAGLLVARAGSSFGFGELEREMPALLQAEPVVSAVALSLLLLGFLVKAGAFPCGLWWLPDAHPAAPSPVSALLSGVMIKLGLYGILRVFVEILPVGSWSLPWGLVIGAIGVLSLTVGTVAALGQKDSKRLLAYSSIGQVGYMLVGFGIGLGLVTRSPALAALGLVAGLFHLLNHACFKGLLFLDAGVFEMATGERDLNRLGGLGRLVPATALATVVASLSVAGLPPFNGFVSKWLLAQASLWGGGGAGIAFVFFGVVGLVVSAVTLAVFVKFLGTTVWGPPSPATRAARPLREWPWLAPGQLVLALACVGLGLVPAAGLWLSWSAAGEIRPLPAFAALFGSGPFSTEVTAPAGGAGQPMVSGPGATGEPLAGVYAPLIATAVFAAAFVLALGLRALPGLRRRRVPAWSCGSEVPSEELRFRADGYYTPLRHALSRLVPERRFVWQPRRPEALARVLNLDTWGTRPFVRGTLRMADWGAHSRAGLPQVYPAWTLIGIGLAVALFLLFWWQGG